VAPIVHLDLARRGPACAEALVLADLLAVELRLPVFLYGELAGGRSRADLRHGGPPELARRVASGELEPDFGPHKLTPEHGAVLVAARPPLVAFNLELEPGMDLESARGIASRVREGGLEGLPGVRAIGVWLSGPDRAQVSTNVEDVAAVALADVVAAVTRHAAVVECEQVGLAPAAAYRGFPLGLRVRGRRTLEQALGEQGPG
jgi:glutamate formiminotransferase